MAETAERPDDNPEAVKMGRRLGERMDESGNILSDKQVMEKFQVGSKYSLDTIGVNGLYGDDIPLNKVVDVEIVERTALRIIFEYENEGGDPQKFALGNDKVWMLVKMGKMVRLPDDPGATTRRLEESSQIREGDSEADISELLERFGKEADNVIK